MGKRRKEWQFDTSPTQGWDKVGTRLGQGRGKVGAMSWARSGQKARFGQIAKRILE